MNDENIIKLAKLGGGCFIAALYAITGMDGVLILMAAFLLGLPIDQFLARRKEE